MPPHTEDAFFPNTSGDVALESPEPAGPIMRLSNSSTNGRAILPPQHSIPFLKRQHVSPASADGSLDRVLVEPRGGGCRAGLVAALQSLQSRTSQLLAETETANATLSPVSIACRHSLLSRMPLVLRQCQILVDRACARRENAEDDEENDPRDGEEVMIATLRSSFALVSAVQFLDTVQEALMCPARVVLEERLRQVLSLADKDAAAHGAFGDDDQRLATAQILRVSHWVAPSLAFDAVCGPTVRTSLQGSLPLNLDVEPVITFKADELLAVDRDLAFRSCRVDVLECRHRPSQFVEGAGGLGVAFVRIRVSPVEDDESSRPPRIWGEQEVEKLVVKEVRAVQLNAFPPKPRAFVDLYTSSVYGDAGTTVTVLIKTSVTENHAIPHLHVELFVAPTLVASH